MAVPISGIKNETTSPEKGYVSILVTHACGEKDQFTLSVQQWLAMCASLCSETKTVHREETDELEMVYPFGKGGVK